MKKRLAVILVIVLLLGIGGAVALGNSAGDPLVTLSYLTNVFAPALDDAMVKRANQDTKPVYDAALKRLKEVGEAGIKTARESKPGYAVLTPQKDKVLKLSEGASLLIYEGSYTLQSGTLMDVTSGDKLSQAGALAVAHRYIASTDSTVLQTSAKGSVGYQGVVTVQADTADPPQPSTLPFTDVEKGVWYYDAVAFSYEKGYFSGVSADQFAPDLSMNRAMLATVLYRLSGDQVTAEQTFSDVPVDQWYSSGITWANKNRVVEGMGGGTYRPEMNVTREQIVTMLYRFQKNYRKGPAPAQGDLSVFPDGYQVATWAQEAMRWAVGQGIITGRDTGVIDPSGNATRAEVATILQRFTSKVSQ